MSECEANHEIERCFPRRFHALASFLVCRLNYARYGALVFGDASFSFSVHSKPTRSERPASFTWRSELCAVSRQGDGLRAPGHCIGDLDPGDRKSTRLNSSHL